ncbi:hypothetical protein PIB30_015681 [Stylosanthes scabra]|uniref:Ubiquitin-like protease family profile domain-containing protein n=1 Tax=Stylosanthes scabra TaxID=79078 RepID=A0ABU6U7D7_9FABA|nr:hypothetical protein [Stylosanthes scabra]
MGVSEGHQAALLARQTEGMTQREAVEVESQPHRPDNRPCPVYLDTIRCYNRLALVGPDEKLNVVSLIHMKVANIPKNMQLVFRPSKDMAISGVELAVACYIFSKSKSQSELLVDVGIEHCNRKALHSLVPRGRVMSDVGVNYQSAPSAQFGTPSAEYRGGNAFGDDSSFHVQATLERRQLSPSNLATFMGLSKRCKVDKVTRVCQPMWSNGHWFLMIIDVPNYKLQYLDSLKCKEEMDARHEAMKRVVSVHEKTLTDYSALYLESLTLGRDWLSIPDAIRPQFGGYDIEEVEVPQQHRRSMDCEVWVAQWMIRETLCFKNALQVESVTDATRMRLAVDLVLKEYNSLAKNVVVRAIHYWKRLSRTSGR